MLSGWQVGGEDGHTASVASRPRELELNWGCKKAAQSCPSPLIFSVPAAHQVMLPLKSRGLTARERLQIGGSY